MTTPVQSRSDITLSGAPEGLDALVLAQLVTESADGAKAGLILHIARDDRRVDALETALAFFAPKTKVVSFPAWDTVPYDRVSPNTEIVVKTMVGSLRDNSVSRASAVMRLATISVLGLTRS